MKKRVMDEHGQFTDIDKLPSKVQVEIETNSKRIQKKMKEERLQKEPSVMSREMDSIKEENESLKSQNSELMSKMDLLLSKLEEKDEPEVKVRVVTKKKKEEPEITDDASGKDDL